MYKAIALTVALVSFIYLLLLLASPLPEIHYHCEVSKASLAYCGGGK